MGLQYEVLRSHFPTQQWPDSGEDRMLVKNISARTKPMSSAMIVDLFR